MSGDTPQRWCPERDFPAYTFVPGKQPHPSNDEEGHSYGEPEPNPSPLKSEVWQDSLAYLYGVDLFNYGYYWEAHEVWEGLWHAAGRTGTTADFLKGLIKLAAAGVKIRQKNSHGIRKHAGDARRLFSAIQDSTETFAGMDLASLVEFAEQVQSQTGDFPTSDSDNVTPVFSDSLPLIESV